MSDEEPAMPRATVTTQVELKPNGSQTLLVAMVVLAGVSLIAGAGMLMMDKDAGWAFVALSLLFAAAPAWGWFSAQADTDLHDSKPTTISTANGLIATTDSRTLRSPAATQALAQLIEVSQRQKLPQADGIIENGVLLPDSAEAANVVVQQINDIVEEQARALDAQVQRLEDVPTVAQRPEVDISPDDSSLRLNVVSSG
ncbi:hypothetical protein ACFOHT_19430 [Massilia oculi]|uniref:Uncharacterized protein n=1 Tax=Massilia oculi TaxID=945844 RepID=A0A2S2DKK2_9BURK|nr:hypothetical protein [Massilia oculi]AWL05900.1 hypothetical protein DIR46_16675 [Massilia oculi]